MRYTEPILKALKKEPLTGIKLLKESNKFLDEHRQSNKPEPFQEALLELLDKKLIQIEEYQMVLDVNRPRPQSMHQDGFIFSLVKIEPNDIRQLIDRLENPKEKIFEKEYQELKNKIIGIKTSNVNRSFKNDTINLINRIDPIERDQNVYQELKNKIAGIEPSNVNESLKEDMINLINKVNPTSSNIYQMLKRLFVKKIDDIENNNLQKWKSLLKYKVKEKEPTEDEILYYEAFKTVNNAYKNDKEMQEGYTELDLNMLVISKMEELKEKIPEISANNKNLKLFLLEVPKEKDSPLNLPSQATDEDYQRAYWEKDYEQNIQLHDPKPKSINDKYLFTDKSLTKEDFLKQYGFISPIKRDLKYKYEFFYYSYSCLFAAVRVIKLFI